ncbi:hypothetical protein LTR12_018141, partial [Friedmanniomyces endolithicus]
LALAEQVTLARAVLNRLGLPIHVQSYSVLEPGHIRQPGQTSIVIAGVRGHEPRVFMNESQLILPFENADENFGESSGTGNVAELSEESNDRGDSSDSSGDDTSQESGEAESETANELMGRMVDFYRRQGYSHNQAQATVTAHTRSAVQTFHYTPEQAIRALWQRLQQSNSS